MPSDSRKDSGKTVILFHLQISRQRSCKLMSHEIKCISHRTLAQENSGQEKRFYRKRRIAPVYADENSRHRGQDKLSGPAVRLRRGCYGTTI